MSSNSYLVRAKLATRPNVTLSLVWAAIAPFADRFEIRIKVDADALPATGELPFVDEANEVTLDDAGNLSLMLNCWAGGHGFTPEGVEPLCDALAKLLVAGGTVEIIDCDASPANDDARAFRCIGVTKADADEARAIHAFGLAREVLSGCMSPLDFCSLAAKHLSRDQHAGKVQKLQFSRNIDSLLVQADENGVWVHCGWSMGIQRAKAVEYVKMYNTDPSAGFYEHDGKVTLSHNGAKISLEPTEGAAVVALIKAAYPEPVVGGSVNQDWFL